MVRTQLRVIDWCRGQVAGSVGAASRASSGAAEAREALKLAYEAYSGKEIATVEALMLFTHRESTHSCALQQQGEEREKGER